MIIIPRETREDRATMDLEPREREKEERRNMVC